MIGFPRQIGAPPAAAKVPAFKPAIAPAIAPAAPVRVVAAPPPSVALSNVAGLVVTSRLPASAAVVAKAAPLAPEPKAPVLPAAAARAPDLVAPAAPAPDTIAALVAAAAPSAAAIERLAVVREAAVIEAQAGAAAPNAPAAAATPGAGVAVAVPELAAQFEGVAERIGSDAGLVVAPSAVLDSAVKAAVIERAIGEAPPAADAAPVVADVWAPPVEAARVFPGSVDPRAALDAYAAQVVAPAARHRSPWGAVVAGAATGGLVAGAVGAVVGGVAALVLSLRGGR